MRMDGLTLDGLTLNPLHRAVLGPTLRPSRRSRSILRRRVHRIATLSYREKRGTLLYS
ncbi:hypothetical protein Rcae01_04382 [Novipirellula caenicola]|uniref:Uncharacterized protein n=1 Tax=Novipirellula caenicola TaxID=1536901 RepID=A0ABP9VZ84_9BACT